MNRKKDKPKDAPRQYTRILMLPIDSTLDAEDLAVRCSPTDVDRSDRDDLIRLLCGIAAIENPMRRQEIAQAAIKAVWLVGNESLEALAAHVSEIY